MDVVLPLILAVSLLSRDAENIHQAAADGNVQEVEGLLARNGQLISSRNKAEETLLHDAVHSGRESVVRLLLDRGADVNASSCDQTTPLHLAIDPKIVTMLLRHRPNLEVADWEGRTPLQQAAVNFAHETRIPGGWVELIQRFTVLRLLLDAGAKYDVLSAIYLGDVNGVRRLLEANPKLLRDRGPSPVLPLRLAAREGQADICRLLLARGADPEDKKNGLGYSVLYDAINHPAVVALLIKAGAKANERISYEGSRLGLWIVGDEATPLHFAAAKGAAESARLLLAAGANVNAADAEGMTSLHIASLCGHGEVARLLLQSGANPSAKSKNGKTPLDLADKLRVGKGGAAKVLSQYKPKS